MCWNLGCFGACRNCILPYPALFTHYDWHFALGCRFDSFMSYPPNCWHGSPFTQKFLQLCTWKRYPIILRIEGCWFLSLSLFLVCSTMSGKERCLSERQIFQYQVPLGVSVVRKTQTFQEAFKKFDTSTTGQVKTKLLGDILRQLSFNPTKNELQVGFLGLW